MKSLILALWMAALCIGLAPSTADAKRIGGGSSAGMQRAAPPKTPQAAAPAQQAQPTPAAPATAGAPPVAPKRSWMGPLAGLAAGLGIAALMSHFGMGEGMGNILTMLLIAGLAFVAIRFLLNRFARNASPAMATPNGMQFASDAPQTAPAIGGSGAAFAAPAAALAAPVAVAAASHLPADFDAPAFERVAKMIFIRMQAANDSADLNDLRVFTTPEMFASIKLDLQDRGNAAQQTDVVRIDAEVIEVTAEAQRQIVSVRFHGLIREEKDGVAAPFDEVWHLVKPIDGSHEWAIAGIQQSAVA